MLIFRSCARTRKMSDVEASSGLPVLAVTAAVGAIVLLFVLLCGVGRKKEQEEDNNEPNEEEIKEQKKSHQQPPKKKEKVVVKKREGRVAFNHPWLAGALKGHSSPVLGIDFSSNGKYLASCAEDRSIHLWTVKDFQKKEHKHTRSNVEFDHATQVRFSPDCKAYIISLFNANTVRVIKFGRKDDGSIGNFQTALDFPKEHDAELINVGISSNGRFIMTCAKDTYIKIWDLKGDILAVIDTHQMNNSYGAVSPCGRFVASSGFTPDVKVWEVCFDRSGIFKEVIRAFDLKGHTSGIYHFAFSNCSHRMATISKDGTWKLWDTNVEYEKQQDPKVLKTGHFNHLGPCLISLSPDASTIAVSSQTNIYIYSSFTTECEQTIEEAHAASITCLEFDTQSQYLVSAGDKNINIFHNITGYRSHISELEEQKRNLSNNTHKERVQQQILQAKSKLAELKQSLS